MTDLVKALKIEALCDWPGCRRLAVAWVVPAARSRWMICGQHRAALLLDFQVDVKVIPMGAGLPAKA